MKKNLVTALLVLLPTLLFVAGVFTYNRLSSKYSPTAVTPAATESAAPEKETDILAVPSPARESATPRPDAKTVTPAPAVTPAPVATSAPEPAATPKPIATPATTPKPAATPTPEPVATPKPAVATPAPELAPDFTVLDYAGNSASLSEHLGRPVMINLWATWCGPCTSELPHFQAAYDTYGGEIDFMMVNLTDGRSDTVDSVKDFVSNNGYSFPVYFDTEFEAAIAYNVSAIPMTVLIGADDAVITNHIGSMDADTLESYIALLR